MRHPVADGGQGVAPAAPRQFIQHSIDRGGVGGFSEQMNLLAVDILEGDRGAVATKPLG